ncbi:MAG: hypothetical protein E6Q98_02945 [Rhodospirillaceae bacterium]|nr:MAG: hypothetical protein E6Q98_02945 [Rhodospirillaceae bacterium]
MYRIDVETALAVKPAYPAGGQGGFWAGCDGVNTFGTDLDHHWHNRVQEEIVNVILGAGIPLDAGNDAQMYQAILQIIQGAPTGRLLRRRKLISSGTLTKATDLLPATKRIDVWCYGPSGGSGGVKGGSSMSPVGGGGGAGGASMKSFLVADLDPTEPYLVGAGGTAGTSTTDGGNGGVTSFGTAPYFQATGGKGGVSVTSGAPGSNTGDGGVGIGGDINLRGQSGSPGYTNPQWSTFVEVLPGAASPGPYGSYGPPGRLTAATMAGVAPDPNSGAGPTGANPVYNTVAAVANGAAGSDGFLIIEEYDA